MLKRYIFISFVLHILFILILSAIPLRKKERAHPPALIANIITKENKVLDKIVPKISPLESPPVPQLKAPVSAPEIKEPTIAKQKLEKPIKKAKPIHKELANKTVMKTQNTTPKPAVKNNSKTIERSVRTPLRTPSDYNKNQKTVQVQSNTSNGENLMSKLFDSKMIEEHALNTIKKAHINDKKNGISEKDVITFDIEQMKYTAYLKRLKESIEGAWKYPEDQARQGVYGDLYISFTIKENGSLGEIKVVRTSGYRSLDDAALEALKDAGPFWPLPKDWGVKSFTIKGHFVYTLYGNYLY
ncbi:TonB-like protein [Candidatus Magnetoovum chiemensis]|nr:TonB-like protein [Candidatus Magnetoovum chiemensis]